MLQECNEKLQKRYKTPRKTCIKKKNSKNKKRKPETYQNQRQTRNVLLQTANKETRNSLEKTPENTMKTTKYKKGSQKFTSNEGICSKKVEENYKRKKGKLGTHQKRHKTQEKYRRKTTKRK